MKTPDIIIHGKDNGDNTIIHYTSGKGTDIFGLAIPNLYAGTEWDLGPTWCYLIAGRKVTLIDTGRFGNLELFIKLLKLIDQDILNINRVIVTHSHEDHDGNLADILSLTRAELWAHEIYPHMISYYPEVKDGAEHPDLPGSCRVCHMPEKFYVNCFPYHRKRSSLAVNLAIKDSLELPDDDLSFIFTPGHSPDAICIVLENEVLFAGDTILPDITPHPSLVHDFEVNRQILPEKYRRENHVYGLLNYIKSLSRIIYDISAHVEATFPAHRLFYDSHFNVIDSPIDRAREIIRFHIKRCGDIRKILDNKPANAEEISMRLFSSSQLTGIGSMRIAQNEVLAHLEIMEECGDISRVGVDGSTVQSTGSEMYLSVLGAYLS